MSLLIEIDRFLRKTDMPPTRFGREAVNDPRLVFDIRRGRECGAKVRARILAYIAAQMQARS
ncbi:hypothetical protein [Parasphingopyxis sp.]|uniref:hypothetical protein n=1 Tax=Parasphingopyxis sp. TaxID=1920299 RepID=UPI0026259F64|nr:hypothetical protein [Parasphingopyxis sp.]